MPAAEGGATPAGNSETQLLLLDACCAINLYATGRIEEILSGLPYRFAMAKQVQGEALSIRRGGDGDDAHQREPVAWGPLVASGRLEVLALGSEAEVTAFVSLAAEMDDGEAATCALALHRGYGVATDDRKARRVLARLAPRMTVRSTLELLYRWCQVRGTDPAEVRILLTNVRQRGNFLPPRGDPLRPWWERALSDAGGECRAPS